MTWTQIPVLPKVIQRPRLEELIKNALDKNLILITGSPGQGKTTLVANVLQRLPNDIFWYSLDKTDLNPLKFIGDLKSFLQYFTFTKDADVDSNSIDHDENIPATLEELLKNISITDDLFIVLDNFQVVANSEEFDVIVQSILSNASPNLHVIIISREEPHWNLSQIKLQRKLLEIDNRQLSFLPDEVSGFFKEIYDLSFSPEQISRLSEFIAGWTPVMVLLGEFLFKEGYDSEILNLDAAGFFQRIPELSVYLEQECYNSLSSEQQDFLLKTSIVNKLSYDLIHHLVGEKGEPVFDQLIAKNLLICFVEKEDRVYRKHPLWQLFLIQKTEEAWGRDKIQELHRKAGEYFCIQEHWKKAIYHYVQGRDLERAIEVLKRSGPEVLDFKLADELQSLVNIYPDDPWLKFAFACSVRFRDPAICHHYLQQALEEFRNMKDTKGEVQALCLSIEVFVFFPGDLHKMKDLLADTSSYNRSKKSSDLRINAYKNVYAAMAHCWLTGQLEEAVRLGESARRISIILQDKNLMLWACWATALASSFIGNFKVAEKRLKTALTIIDSPEIDDIISVFIPYMVGLNADFMGEFGVAHSFLEEAHKKAEKLKMEALGFYINNYASYSALYRGDTQLCEKLLNDMGDFIGMCMVGEHGHLSSFFWAWRGHYMYVTGQYHEAIALTSQALRIRKKVGGEVYHIQCHLVLGGALREAGNLEESEYHLLEALKRSTSIGSYFYQASCYLQLAMLYDVLNREELFFRYIDDAFKLAMEKSFFHFFMWRDDKMARIITQTRDKDQYRGYIKELYRRRFTSNVRIPTPNEDKFSVKQASLKPIKIHMLGQLVIDINGTIYKNIGLKKAMNLLTLLAVKSAPVSMELIIEEMWPDRDIKLAKNNFHYTLNRLRNFLGNPELIILKDGLCSLNLDKCWIDVRHFKKLNERAKQLISLNKKSEASDLLQESSRVYRGDLLEGESLGPFLSIERNALAKYSYDSLVTLGTLLLELGNYEKAVNILTEACFKAFADEDAYRLLMLAHYECGHQWQALQTYNKLDNYLASELDASPHPKTKKLRNLIRDGIDQPIPVLIKWLLQKDKSEVIE